jgi:hypothetical protein
VSSDRRRQLVADLRAGREAFVSAITSLDPGELERGRYENGWNGREIVAHVAAIEWTYPRLIELAKTARPEAGDEGRADGSARDGMDGYNARQVAKRAQASVGELLAEFIRNRDAFIAAIEAAEDAVFEAPVRSAGGRVGTLGDVLYEVSVGHVGGHLADIVGNHA